MMSANQNFAPRSWTTVSFYIVALGFFATWFGGFTFYASVVVPIGTDILGSARAQGEITQQVSDWINRIALFTSLLLIVEHFLFRRKEKRLLSINFLVVIGILVFAGLLIWLNQELDQMIEQTTNSIRVTNRERFYRQHRLYLWVSTGQWFLGWIWIGRFVYDFLCPEIANKVDSNSS